MRAKILAILVVCSVCLARGERVGAQVQVTDPDQESRALFLTHCASCHGEDGRGGGIVAAAMKIPPSDLTQISKRREGQFPYDEMRAIISGLKLESVHGTRAMPVWGRVFAQMEPTQHGRLNLLLMYLVSIQEQ